MMNIKGIIGTAILHLAWAPFCFCQVPPNDNFADRIVLTGNNITFTGNLTGSTLEPNEPTNAPGFPGYPAISLAATHSVWWSWTATESSPVTLVALSYSEDNYVQGFDDGTSVLAVYVGTNVFGAAAPGYTNALWLNAAFNKLAMSFQAVAGISYQIQFFGVHPTLAVTFQLIATNPPVILEAPTDQTIYPNGSALFTVVSAGIPPFYYQWRRDGVELPGQTWPMLALNNVAPEQAGAYAVVVSNLTGSVTSQTANLVISSNPVQPRLATSATIDSNSFAFTLAGETGRYYRIESSTNLRGWHAESSFASWSPPLVYAPYATLYRSIIYSANSTSSLSIPKSTSAAFVRAALYSAPNEICNNNLRQIRFAKELWIRDQSIPARSGVPTFTDLQPYASNILTLACPDCPFCTSAEMSYLAGPVLADPVCKISPNHILEQPR